MSPRGGHYGGTTTPSTRLTLRVPNAVTRTCPATVDPTIRIRSTMFERPSLDEGADFVVVGAAESAGDKAARPA
jgi:hypothetical protein